MPSFDFLNCCTMQQRPVPRAASQRSEVTVNGRSGPLSRGSVVLALMLRCIEGRRPSVLRVARVSYYKVCLSVGESLSKRHRTTSPGICRSRPHCQKLSVSVGAAPSLQAPEVALTRASRSAATFDTGSMPGDALRPFGLRSASVPAPRYASTCSMPRS